VRLNQRHYIRVMKKNIAIVFIFVSLGCTAQNYSKRTIVGEQYATQAVKNALNDTQYKTASDTLIRDKETAISIAESIVSNIFGKNTIIAERPYECYLVDGYWYVAGTLPKNYKGGVFEIIISAKDGRIIRLGHGK